VNRDGKRCRNERTRRRPLRSEKTMTGTINNAIGGGQNERTTPSPAKGVGSTKGREGKRSTEGRGGRPLIGGQRENEGKPTRGK